MGSMGREREGEKREGSRGRERDGEGRRRRGAGGGREEGEWTQGHMCRPSLYASGGLQLESKYTASYHSYCHATQPIDPPMMPAPMMELMKLKLAPARELVCLNSLGMGTPDPWNSDGKVQLTRC